MRPMRRESLVCCTVGKAHLLGRLTLRAVAMGFGLAGYSTQYVQEMEDWPTQRGFLLYQYQERQRKGGILLPCRRFLIYLEYHGKLCILLDWPVS